MTVLLNDAEAEVEHKYGKAAEPWLVTRDLLYADDTLILETKAEVAQSFMDAVAQRGGEYGLALNWGKVKLLRINHPGHIYTPTGAIVE